jgi:uncharacterized protein YjbI with pentapeptide repeats
MPAGPTRWHARVPEADRPALDETPVVDPDEPVLRDVRIAGRRLTPAESLDGLEITDVVLDGCDVAGLVCTGGRASGLRMRSGRIRGITWARGLFRDVLLEGVTGEEVSVRFGTLRRVEFRDCSLPGLDLTEVTGERVRLVGCDLSGAKFDHARIRDLRIAGCVLAGASGLDALRGASVHPDDIASMALGLARANGICVEPDEPAPPLR